MEPSRVRLARMSSIEREPKTLTFHQIQHAREAALYVIRTKTQEEALSIFTEGLQTQPVLNIQNKGDYIHDDILELKQHQGLVKTKNIVSAPFLTSLRRLRIPHERS